MKTNYFSKVNLAFVAFIRLLQKRICIKFALCKYVANMKFAKLCNQRKGGNGRICTKRANSAIVTFALVAKLCKFHICNIFAPGKFGANSIFHPVYTVDHEILVSKLNAYGIRHEANDWFKSYLSDRTQKRLVNGFLSEDRFISCGVPQGTILGPLLFLLYINDLPNCLKHSHPWMFADDTHLTYSAANVHDIDQNLNQDLKIKNVSEWLAANKLTLNASKTEFMLIGRGLGLFPRLLP